MTRAEYLDRLRAIQRRRRPAGLLLLGLFLTVGAGVPFLGMTYGEHTRSVALIAAYVGGTVALGALFLLQRQRTEQAMRAAGLICPCCGATIRFASPRRSALDEREGRCPECRGQVFDDAIQTLDPRLTLPSPTRPERRIMIGIYVVLT